ncbi:MAG: hypothetical protein M3280_08325 [Actinomycetota bacterium]|nr:hypothetical protein [Actinomycetota bacterium]
MAILTAGFLVVLVLAWAAVCLPAATRARHQAPFTSVRRFKRDMRVISIPGSLELPDQDDDSLLTVSDWLRRAIGRVELNPRGLKLHVGRILGFGFVLSLVVVSFVVAAFRGGAGWEIHLACLALASFHVAWLLETKRRNSGSSKIRSLASYRRDLNEYEPVRLRAASGRF